MENSTDGPARPSTAGNVVAVIYDRLAAPSRAWLNMRLEACREYAAERGWTVAAEHIDTGNDALHDRSRPGVDEALKDVQKAANDAASDQAVLLVFNFGRLSHDAMNLAMWRYRVDLAGGTVATVEDAGEITRATVEKRTEVRP